MTFSTREHNALGLQKSGEKLKLGKKGAQGLRTYSSISSCCNVSISSSVLAQFSGADAFSRASDQLALKQSLPLLEPSGLIFWGGGHSFSSHLESQILDGRTERRK